MNEPPVQQTAQSNNPDVYMNAANPPVVPYAAPVQTTKRRWWHWHRKADIKPSAIGIFRDVFVNLLAAAVLAGLGWGAYRAVGLFGVHYEDAVKPWKTSLDSYYGLDLSVIPIMPKRFYSESLDAEKMRESIRDAKKNLTTFSTNNSSLAELKAAKKGKLVQDLAQYQKNSKRYATYASARVGSTEALMDSLVVCSKIYNGTDTGILLPASKACETALASVDQTKLTDFAIVTFHTDFQAAVKTYTGLLTALDKTPSTNKQAISAYSTKIFKHRNDIDATYSRVSYELMSENKKINLGADIKKVSATLNSLVE